MGRGNKTNKKEFLFLFGPHRYVRSSKIAGPRLCPVSVVSDGTITAPCALAWLSQAGPGHLAPLGSVPRPEACALSLYSADAWEEEGWRGEMIGLHNPRERARVGTGVGTIRTDPPGWPDPWEAPQGVEKQGIWSSNS